MSRFSYTDLDICYNFREYGRYPADIDGAELEYMPKFTSDAEMRSVYYFVSKTIESAIEEFNITHLTNTNTVLSFTGVLINSTSFLLSLEILDKES